MCCNRTPKYSALPIGRGSSKQVRMLMYTTDKGGRGSEWLIYGSPTDSSSDWMTIDFNAKELGNLDTLYPIPWEAFIPSDGLLHWASRSVTHSVSLSLSELFSLHYDSHLSLTPMIHTYLEPLLCLTSTPFSRLISQGTDIRETPSKKLLILYDTKYPTLQAIKFIALVIICFNSKIKLIQQKSRSKACTL